MPRNLCAIVEDHVQPAPQSLRRRRKVMEYLRKVKRLRNRVLLLSEVLCMHARHSVNKLGCCDFLSFLKCLMCVGHPIRSPT